MQEILSYSETEALFKAWKLKYLRYLTYTLIGVGIFLIAEFLFIGQVIDPTEASQMIYLTPLGAVVIIIGLYFNREREMYRIGKKEIKQLVFYKQFETEGIKFPVLYIRNTGKNNETIPAMLLFESDMISVRALKAEYPMLRQFPKHDLRFVFTEIYQNLDMVYKEKFHIVSQNRRYTYYLFKGSQKKFIDYLSLETYQVDIIKK